jgi:DNA polymerase-3 subunit beta
VEEEGAITVPARLLADFVNSLPDDLIEIVLPAGASTLELASGRFRARINGISADDFPPIPQVSDGITAKVEADALKEGISQVAIATAAEETRPVLTGIYAELEEDDLNLVSADGFRLAVYRMKLASSVKDKVAVIIPSKTLGEISRLLGDQDEQVEISLDHKKGQALFRLRSAEVVSQLIQGAFPSYSQVIPQEYTTRAVMDVAEFLRITRMSSIFARDASGIVRLVISPGSELAPGKVTVSAQAEEVGDNVGEIDALVDGAEAKIAFNVKYLSDVLSVIPQDQIAIEITNSSSPGVIRPIGIDGYVHVIMPMFVQWEN